MKPTEYAMAKTQRLAKVRLIEIIPTIGYNSVSLSLRAEIRRQSALHDASLGTVTYKQYLGE